MAPTGGRRPRPGLLAWTAGQHHRKRFLESQALEPPPRAFSQQVWSGLCWAWGQEAGASLRQEKALLFIPLTVSKWGGGVGKRCKNRCWEEMSITVTKLLKKQEATKK